MTKPYLVGGAEFAALYDVKRLQVSQWISRDHTLDYRYAKIISGSPYWLLQFAKRFGETTPRPRQLQRGRACAHRQGAVAWLLGR